MTKEVLNNSKRISFIVTGKSKAKVISELLNGLPISKNYPASEIKPTDGIIDWMIDKEAAFYL
ncbi:MAG: 6-phosphogluconolactonase [Bacteroidetes bacterium]|nr:6-phosphogluconolactonase [Bacteroidota bacterium]